MVDQFVNTWGIRLCGFTATWRIPKPPPQPHYLGNALRGILGHALFAAVCPYQTPQCSSCLMAEYCYYAAVFKPQNTKQLPAYILHDWWLQDNVLTVNLLLLGSTAVRSTEPWIKGLHEHLPQLDWYGSRGMKLIQVNDWYSGQVLFKDQRFIHHACIQSPDHWPCIKKTVQLRFITPLVTKHQGQDPVFSALKTRLQRLCHQFGDGRVLFNGDTSYWHSHIVYRQRTQLKFGKSQRQLAASYYHLLLTEIHPEAALLLGAGLWLHAGGQTGFGLGRYCCLI